MDEDETDENCPEDHYDEDSKINQFDFNGHDIHGNQEIEKVIMQS